MIPAVVSFYFLLQYIDFLIHDLFFPSLQIEPPKIRFNGLPIPEQRSSTVQPRTETSRGAIADQAMRRKSTLPMDESTQRALRDFHLHGIMNFK